jgi:creatinine amidohydrolase/Fe(II)-dependent formamide hydrolase-like protein
MRIFIVVAWAAIGLLGPRLAVAIEPDVSKFPQDRAVLPARLENMRPGQIRDAVARGAPCLLPVGTLESGGGDRPLGGDAEQADAALLALAGPMHAVIAPPIWYTPTGYILGGPRQGTFDMPLDSFADYLREVLRTLAELGFKRVQVVPLHNPQGADGPLHSGIQFVLADLFNDLWKDPRLGRSWWIRPDREALPYKTFSLAALPKVDGAEKRAAANARLPLRLERMRPSQIEDALRRGLPCFVPVGVLENHGNHCPIGCDTFEAQDPLLLAATRAPAVVAPAVWYGPTGYAVTGPQRGTTDVNGAVFQWAMQGVVAGLAAMGFENVVFVGVHQGEAGAEQASIRMAIQQYRGRLHALPGYGPGWGNGENPRPARTCNLEMISPPGGAYDHAGRNETSWMLFLRGEHTDLTLIRPNDYPFCWEKGGPSNTATRELGRQMTEKVVGRLVELIEAKTRPGPSKASPK